MRPITPEEHLAAIADRGSASFLQTPAWGRVKTEWRAESVGWFSDEDPQRPIGAALVLYRPLPTLPRSLAYVPEGPVLDWASPQLPHLLDALRAHVRSAGAFALRIGPPVVLRRWGPATVKAAMADPECASLLQVPPDGTEPLGELVRTALRARGFRPQPATEGFAAGQPEFVFQLPVGGRDEAAVLAGMNQLWRRNIKKSARAGVVVSRGTAQDLPAFYAGYVETAHRDGFSPRPLAYFQRMFAELLAEDPDRVRLYLAHHEGDLVAATIWVRVLQHVWYSYGASSSAKRQVQGSTAIQWQMMRDAMDAGATVYDLRGITDSVREDDAHLGLLRFKVGTGGDAVQYVGEWDLPLNRPLYHAFRLYLRRR